jgi:hypothetical protein
VIQRCLSLFLVFDIRVCYALLECINVFAKRLQY